MSVSKNDKDAFLELFGSEYEPYIDTIPDILLRELVANDKGFIRRHQMSLKLAKAFKPEHRDLASPDALRAILAPTAYKDTRMQPLYGAMGQIQSLKHPRYGFFPYIPMNFMLEPSESATLIVAVHGSSRNAKDQRDAFIEFAEENNCFVLAPLFPIEMDLDVAPDEAYKYVATPQHRFDLTLFDMIDEFSKAVNVNFSKVMYFGFSGGAQFCHRLLYAHPDKMDVVAVAAPGYVTLPSDDHQWWGGTGGMRALFGKDADIEGMKDTPLLLICGSEDVLPFEIYDPEETGLTSEAFEAYGKNRTQRIEGLHKAYQSIGVQSELQYVDDCSHDFQGELHTRVRTFMLNHM